MEFCYKWKTIRLVRFREILESMGMRVVASEMDGWGDMHMEDLPWNKTVSLCRLLSLQPAPGGLPWWKRLGLKMGFTREDIICIARAYREHNLYSPTMRILNSYRHANPDDDFTLILLFMEKHL
jgi:hypothetical protein